MKALGSLDQTKSYVGMMYCFHPCRPLKKRPVVMGNFPRIRPKPFQRLLWIEECLDKENLMRMTFVNFTTPLYPVPHFLWQHTNMTTCSLQVEFPHLLVVLINIGLKCSGLKQLHGSLNQKSTKRAAEQLLFAFQTSMCFWWAAATFTGKPFDFRVNSHHSILAHVASKQTRVPQHAR